MLQFRVKYLSFFFGLISILSFFNIIYSYYFNFYLNLNTYYFSLISSFVIAVIFYKIKASDNKSSIFEKILTVFLGYILLPLILLIPFSTLSVLFESKLCAFHTYIFRFLLERRYLIFLLVLLKQP